MWSRSGAAGWAAGSVSLDAEDARYVVALRRVVYLRRFLREARVGFGVA